MLKYIAINEDSLSVVHIKIIFFQSSIPIMQLKKHN